jgi:hypothetical protein
LLTTLGKPNKEKGGSSGWMTIFTLQASATGIMACKK